MYNNQKILVSMIIVLLCSSLTAQTHLNGTLSSRILSKEESPCIIDADMLIPKNSVVTIKPGVILLFKPYTGINVYGSLIVEGRQEEPVVFSSIKKITLGFQISDNIFKARVAGNF